MGDIETANKTKDKTIILSASLFGGCATLTIAFFVMGNAFGAENLSFSVMTPPFSVGFLSGLVISYLFIRNRNTLLSKVLQEREASSILMKEIEERHKAEKANLTKSQFLANMSHELRTPLNAIIGFGEMLKYLPDDKNRSKHKEYTDHIIESGKHLLDLVSDILDLAKIESGSLKLEYVDFDILDCAKDCASFIDSMAAKNNINIDVMCCCRDKSLVHADPLRVRQVLLNILSNAVKYSRENGYIGISCETHDGFGRITVEDDGVGISEEFKPFVFQPLTRDSATSKDIEGTGIGLSIAHELMIMMGGNIGFDSDPDKGSKFWVDIPLSPPGKKIDSSTQ